MFTFRLSDEAQDKLRYVAMLPAMVGTFLMALGGTQKDTPAGVTEMSVGARCSDDCLEWVYGGS